MTGKTITDHQRHKYKQHRHKLSQVASAAKAGISERSARRIVRGLARSLRTTVLHQIAQRLGQKRSQLRANHGFVALPEHADRDHSQTNSC